MDAEYIERMKGRLKTMRKVAAMAHDPAMIQMVTEAADELEADIRKLEAEAPPSIEIHVKPRADG